MDKLLTFSNNVALTGDAESEAIDMVAIAPHGNSLSPLQVSVGNTSFTSSGSSTLTVKLEIADNESFTTNKRSYVLANAVPKAKLVAGYRIVGDLSALPVDEKFRFMRLAYDVETANFTAGNINAWFGSNLETKA